MNTANFGNWSKWGLSLYVLSLSALTSAQAPQPQPGMPQANTHLTRLENLGQRLFTDRNLSEPVGTACVSCHTANTGFANNHGSRIGVALGSTPSSFGLRNAMSNAYNGFIPKFSFQISNGEVEAIGGHFWDGRADTLAAQALGPFLASAEMNNPNAAAVVKKVAASPYADLMRAEFGNNVFQDSDSAYQKIGTAIAAFELTPSFQSFSSKYDAFIQGKTTLTPNENRGMMLFMDTKKANCVSCHVMNPKSKDPKDSLFSEFSFYATGIPRNRAIAQNANPNFFDLGLCGPVRSKPALTANVPVNISIDDFCGKFRMPSLRNVAERQAFMHNGFFKDLREVVGFYATVSSDPQRWYGPAGVPNDLPMAYLKNIVKDRPPFNRPRSAGPVLSPVEVDDIVAFLHTLSDGYTAAPPLPQNPGPQPNQAPNVRPANPFGPK